MLSSEKGTGVILGYAQTEQAATSFSALPSLQASNTFRPIARLS